MNRVISFIFFIGIVTLVFQSCTFVRGVRIVRNEKVKIEPIKLTSKKIVFIPISHIGQTIFYNDLKDTVQSLKNNGFSIFYEGISHKGKDYDSITSDILIKKMRKIFGGRKKTYKEYPEMTKIPAFRFIFKDPCVQPKFEELGISETDVNADINIEQLVKLSENKFGIIELDSIDLITPADLSYSGKYKGKYMRFLNDERNQNLANMVKNSFSEKIAIIYGADHYKGIKKYIRNN